MKTLVIAPHPDDETLGVGGTILKRISKKNKVAWLIVTNIPQTKKNKKIISEYENIILKVKNAYKFEKVYKLNLSNSKLDTLQLKTLIDMFSKIFKSFKPNEIFIPHPIDAHTDHKIIFEAVSATTKVFRYPYIKKILSYETLSETGYGLTSQKDKKNFFPNYYVNISKFLKKKINIARIYKKEFKKHPFPRSILAIKSLARIRGAESNNKFAEAFELLRNIED
tara:strand:+ start:8274 stop:8945 length:672 start_codon:yes stop_codon:yes gene_type:complete